MLIFSITSFIEEQKRAANRALVLAFCLSLPYFFVSMIDYELRELVCIIVLSFTFIVPIMLLLPIGNNFEEEDEKPKKRIDERTIMFCRSALQKGSKRFDEFYKLFPEYKKPDDEFRSLPGLIQKGATFYEPITAAAAFSGFSTIHTLHQKINEDEKLKPKQNIDSKNIAIFLKKWLKNMGAVSVGVAKLQEYHKYNTIGRGNQYGEPVKLDHENAIAFTVEMDKNKVSRAPKGPTVMESAQQYLNSGTMAVQLAEFIHHLGYSARAHIDGNYNVICPLVARDAGLGEIGRMGLLMTPELGPRVRIAVVTTNLPIAIDDRNKNQTVLDFCRLCRKCADVCPSQAIPDDARKMIQGVKRWQINSESCFTLWCKIGTDCARCMSVCPYSHPNTIMHNLVRWGIRQSRLFRIFALKMDDIFYGRKPKPADIPDYFKGIIRNQD